MAWLPAYLLHGDDHDRVAERRSRLRAAAEREVGAEGVEVLSDEESTPAGAAAALSAMTLGLGRRFVLVEGVERWKDADVTAALVGTLTTIDPETTTVAFVAMEDKKLQAPPALATAIEKIGGSLVAERALKARDLPRWAVGEARRLGIELDGAAAQALVGAIGERRVRLERELEKLALEHGPGARLSTADVEGAVADAAEKRVWDFVDAIMAADRATAVSAYLALRAQGESLARLTGMLASRLRIALEIARRLDAGEDRGAVAKAIRLPPWQADRRVAEARDIGVATLALAVDRVASLELAARGDSTLDQDTEAIRVIGAVTARR
ncbi:DNA polymerase III delta subunit [Patulibacter medicamentivorans]|uniref:DNA-directed DNA polymerase n=1 Tax=Patulibacter medicamentivorans TaxID=1097667 RepID=H0E2L9_9ACTN|nr:DNA polymerase III subunit delta [Patulibacter medicamentivorans]EHN12070.1 DNA polymerase III delta subunit [Patulibacter medicamentivorans]